MKFVQLIAVLIFLVQIQFNQTFTKSINNEIAFRLPFQYYDYYDNNNDENSENIMNEKYQKSDDYYDSALFKNIQKKPSWTLTRFTKSHH